MLTLARRTSAQVCCCHCGCVASLSLLERRACDSCATLHGAGDPVLRIAALGAMVGIALAAARIILGGIQVEPPGMTWFAVLMLLAGGAVFAAVPTFMVARAWTDAGDQVLPFAAPPIIQDRTAGGEATDLRVAPPVPGSQRLPIELTRDHIVREWRLRRFDRSFGTALGPRLQSHDVAILDGFAARYGRHTVFAALDLLYLDGELLTDRPAADRRALLMQVLADCSKVTGISWSVSALPLAGPDEPALLAIDAGPTGGAAWRQVPDAAHAETLTQAQPTRP